MQGKRFTPVLMSFGTGRYRARAPPPGDIGQECVDLSGEGSCRRFGSVELKGTPKIHGMIISTTIVVRRRARDMRSGVFGYLAVT